MTMTEQAPIQMNAPELRAEAHGTIEQLTVMINQSVEISPVNLRTLIGGVAVGSALMEGQPGTGKTLTAKTLATAIGGVYQRIQGSPDMQPSDIIGYEFFDPATRELKFRPGVALRANVLFADELNRNPEKSQAAFLEVMEEGQVTIDGVTYQAQKPLTVLATQNPIEEPGTNPLPRAELDRFAVSFQTDQTPDEEDEVLRRYTRQAVTPVLQPVGLQKVVALRAALTTVGINNDALNTIRAIKDTVGLYAVKENNPESPEPVVKAQDSILNGRAKLRMADLARFHTLARGKEEANVSEEDIVFAAHAVLAHRIALTHKATRAGVKAQHIIDAAITTVFKMGA